MAVLIRCDKCEKKLSIPETGVGKKIRCPACQTVFVAAAASAITAAAPEPRKAAIQKKPAAPPPPLPRADADDADDAPGERPAPRRKKSAQPEPFPPIHLRALVKNKNGVIKKGNWPATLDEQGLLIKRKKLGDVDIPIGTPAIYEGKNKIVITLDDERIEMQIARFRTYQNRFAQLVVDLLSGEVKEVWQEDYEIPWYMFILVLLPLGAPIASLTFGAIPFGVAGGFAGANFAIIIQEDWKPGTRIVVASILTGVAYILLFVLAFFLLRAQLNLFR